MMTFSALMLPVGQQFCKVWCRNTKGLLSKGRPDLGKPVKLQLKVVVYVRSKDASMVLTTIEPVQISGFSRQTALRWC